ncbi:hypothetical protein FWK35_00009990 [Aphis craccivora]|uniref:Uncharacterized protein n=1 Tax=Aphis craccivora TaxID=307492 RepID=A0A6G0ZF41_APHCR|nr:hypothetical protein FWK35_00009990 [Aphis craccivora]
MYRTLKKICKYNNDKSEQLGTALLYIRCRVDHYYTLYRSVKFESNDSYHCIRKTILN